MAKTFLPYLIPFEEELVKKLNIKDKPANPIIAIGGLSGTGKDTHASLLQKKLEERNGLELEVTVAGHFVRELAREEGFEEKNIEQFMKKYETIEKFAETVDKKIERTTLELALRNGGIFVGRMAAFAVGRWGFTVWLTVSPEIAAQRIITDQKRPEFGLSLGEMVKKIVDRDKTDTRRLERVYGIKIKDLIKKVDLVVSNDYPKEQVSEKIYKNCVKFLEENNFV